MFCERWASSGQGKKNPFLSRVAVLTWALRSRILIFAILESHKLKGWCGYPWPCCPELCRWWCVGLQPEQATRGSFLQQPRVGARPPNLHAFVRFACVKQELQENPSCCWTLRVCSLVFGSGLIEWSHGKGHGSALANAGVFQWQKETKEKPVLLSVSPESCVLARKRLFGCVACTRCAGGGKVRNKNCINWLY